MKDHNCDLLIKYYFDLCNAVLNIHGTRFPYKQIFEAAQKNKADTIIECNVLGHTNEVLQTYALKLLNNHIDITPHTECENCNCLYSWNIHIAELSQIIAHTDRYLQNPAYLNWDWLYAPKTVHTTH